VGGRGASLPTGSNGFGVGKKEFSDWFRKPDKNLVINGLPPHIREALGTEATSLTFSAETLAKQKAHHPEICADEYTKVINKINGRNVPIYRTSKDRHICLVVSGGRRWAVILKTTGDLRESYLVSLYRVSEAHSLARIQKHSRIL